MSREQIQKEIRSILETSGLVREAFVYGSFARGEDEPDSDIDLLVHLESDASLLDIAGLKVKLEEAVQRTFDIGENIHPMLRKQVEREKIKIYG